MAPKVINPAFAAEDIKDIVAHYKENNEKAVKNEVSEVPVTHPKLGECVRKYVFNGKVWVYTSTSHDDEDIVDHELEQEAEQEEDELEEKSDKEEKIVEENVAVVEETADSEAEAEQVDSADDSAADDAAAAVQPKKQRKPRAPKEKKTKLINNNDLSLEAVLFALDNLNIIEAKDMLKKMIGGDGAIVPGNKGKAKKVKADKVDKPKRAPTAYTIFMSSALKQVGIDHPDVKDPKKRMQIAMTQWKAHKENIAAQPV